MDTTGAVERMPVVKTQINLGGKSRDYFIMGIDLTKVALVTNQSVAQTDTVSRPKCRVAVSSKLVQAVAALGVQHSRAGIALSHMRCDERGTR